MYNNERVGKFCSNSDSNAWHNMNIASKFEYLNITHQTQYFNIRHHTEFTCAIPLQTKDTKIPCCVDLHAQILGENVEEKYLRSTRCKYILQSILIWQHFTLLLEIWSIQMMKPQKTWMNSGFFHSVNEIFALLGYCTTGISSYLPAFRDNLSVPSSWVKMSKTLENGTDGLSRNVGK